MEPKRKCMVLVITGNPGVGKHTIADLLEKQNSTYKILDINKFAIEEGFGEKIEGEFEVDTEELASEIKHLISHESLIVGHLAPYIFDENDIDLVIVLRKNPYHLIEIYEKRDYQDSKIKENIGSEILGIIANDAIEKFGRQKTFEIDTTDKTPENILNFVIDIINEKRKTDHVDWLELIKNNKDFDKFF